MKMHKKLKANRLLKDASRTSRMCAEAALGPMLSDEDALDSATVLMKQMMETCEGKDFAIVLMAASGLVAQGIKVAQNFADLDSDVACQALAGLTAMALDQIEVEIMGVEYDCRKH